MIYYRIGSNKNAKRSKTIKMVGNPYYLVTGLIAPPSAFFHKYNK